MRKAIIYILIMVGAVIALAQATTHSAEATTATSEVECLYNDFNSITGEMAFIEEQMQGIEDQIDLLDVDLQEYDDSLAALTQSMIMLNHRSTHQLRQARKNRYRLSEVNMYFSNPSVAKAVRRAGYLDECLKENAVEFRSLKDSYFMVKDERDRIADIQNNEELLYAMLDNQNELLWEKHDRAEDIYKRMTADDPAFGRLMQRRALQSDTLNRRINYLLAAEASPKKNDASKTKADKGEKQAPAPETGFEAQKGKLPMPVSTDYNIVGYFGKRELEDFPKVNVDNSGIDIEVPSGTKARAVYGGKVSAVFRSSGYHHIVMVRHGDYITVYANIKNPSVKKNETVKPGQVLGTIYTDSSDKDRTILHFEVRKDKKRLNPLEWVKR